jgi:hypothetical protein
MSSAAARRIAATHASVAGLAPDMPTGLQPSVYYPDVIEAVLSYLTPALAGRPEPEITGVVVGSMVPDPRPAGPLVVATRNGGKALGVLDDAMVDLSCWHTTPHAAYVLAGVTRALLRGIVGTTPSGATIARVEEYMGPALVPDPDSTMPRVLFSTQLSVRGTDLPASGDS